MALFQDEEITQEEFNNQHSEKKEPDIFSNLGYDDIIKERQTVRQKRIDEESNWVNNIVSPDKINDWKKQGSMTALQVWHKKNKNELMPYMGTWAQGSKSFNIKNISDKLQTGQVITPEERKQFEDFVLDLAEIQTRGYSFGGGAMNIGLETIPFMAEFALGLLTTGGTSSFGATTSRLSTEFVKKGLARQIGEGIAKTAYNATINSKTLAFTATRLPQQVRARMGDIMLSDSLAISPEGQAILKESETTPAIAFLKALALTNIEVGSEMSGELLVRPFMQAGAKLGKVIAEPVLKMLPKGFADKFVKLAEDVTKLPFAKAVDTLGWNGILEEMGEERVGDLLQFAFNLDGEDGWSFEQLLDAMFPSVEQLGQEALSFGVTGMGMNAVHNTLRAIPKVGDKYTKDGFLLDAGIFRIQGYDSYLDKKVRETLKEKGKKEDEIDNALHFSSRDDKVQFLKDTKTEFDTKKEFDAKEFEKDLQAEEIKDKTYQKFLQGGVSQDVAFANATLFKQFFRRFGADNKKAFDDWYNKFDVQYNVPAEQNVAQYQSAMKKSEFNSFDDFYNDVLANKQAKEKKQFNYLSKEGLNIRIPHDTVNHEQKKHKLTSDEWNTLLENIDNISSADISKQKSSYDGKSILLKIKADNKVYGVVLETFKKNNPLISTAFIDTEKNIDNWIKNEGVSSGTKTSFLNITLNNIIKDVQPNFKTKVIGNTYFQSAYHGSPHKFDEFSLDAIGTGEGAQAHGWGLYFAANKDVSDKRYRKRLSGDKVFYDGKELHHQYWNANNKGNENYDWNEQWLLEVINKIIKVKGEKQISLEEARKEFINEYPSKGKLLAFQKKKLEIAKNLDVSKIKTQKGQLFEVDIPDEDVLLDEDKPLNEQPEKVQKALKKLWVESEMESDTNLFNFTALPVGVYQNGKEIGENNFVEFPISLELAKKYGKEVALENLQKEKELSDNGEIPYDEYIDFIKNVNLDEITIDSRYNIEEKSGGELYSLISDKLGSDKLASEKLNEYGIKGITYDGRQDGRCYVIFDDKAVNILKTYYQEENADEEKMIAGFSYSEVMEKLTDIYEKLSSEDLSKNDEETLIAQKHILEDAFEISEHPEKFSNDEKRTETMLNAYYIMNNQEIPKDYIEAEAISKRTFDDLKDIRDRKKEEAEAKYYGYFTEGQDKNIITIMANHNSSTALHELGHLFLNGLNELAKANDEAKKQLETVNKWLGFSGEYTIAQQEKFARSFEAYLYKGKAPNNNLRQVFENFKEWLKSVYHQISDLTNKGADISDEVQEMFDNMFSGDEYYQERKQANELLKKVKNISRRTKLEKIPERDDKTLSETQKRCKQVSYEILSVATGKDINYLKRIFETSSNKNGYARRREVVEELLENAEDRITSSGGMRENWKEFYSDTGVSYENDEIDGDFKLAEKALDVVINKAYFDPELKIENRLQDEAEFYEKAINDAEREYKALIKSFKNENRNVALSAMYEWLDKLPDGIKEDYENKFVFDSGIIERNENVDKFDKVKRQILSKAMELQNDTRLDKNESYKNLVVEIMKNLNFLQPSDKAKLTTNILDVPSTSFLMSSIDNILDIAKTMEDVNFRRNLEREIHKELQQTKNVKKNGRTVGKYDYKSNKLFEELRRLDRLSPEQAQEERLENKRFADKEEKGMSAKERLINKFLSYKAGGRTFANTDLMKELYDGILKIKLAGKTAKSELDLMEKLDETKDIEELINIVQNKKNANFAVKSYINGIANLESTLNAIFNKDIQERYGAEVLYAETQSQAWQHEQKQKFEKEVAKIYNLPQWCWDKKILDHLSKKHKFVEIRRKYNEKGEIIKTREVERELTEMDIIQAYIWSKNEILEKRLKNQFGEDTLYSMFELLSNEDKMLANLMMNTAQSFYPLVNKAFINKYGLDLPKVSCYFPSTPERGSEVDLYNDYSSKSLGNGFTKSRAQSEILPMDFHNPVTTLYSHIDGVAKFTFMSDILDKVNLRFKDADLKRVIVNKYGEDAYRTLEQILMNVTYKKEATVFSGMNKVMDNMIGNWIQANVAVKPIVGLKQLLSANNYAVDMPYMTWQAGFLKALANPKETIDYMMKIPYLKARYEGALTNEFLKQTIENSAFATSKKLKDLCGTFIKMGDIGAIIFGGKPYIDYLIKEEGLSEAEAIKKFVISTNRSQQSSAVSSLSNFQVSMTRSPFGKLFIAYKNSPLQYMRMCADALISATNGDMTKGQCAKMLFQFAYLQPFLYAVATSGSILRMLFTGDDDDLMKDLSISIFDLNSSALPLVGDIYRFALDKLVYKEKGMVQTTPLLGDIQKEIAKISKEDVTIADYLSTLAYLTLQIGVGYNTKAIGSMASGIGDIANGEVGQGALKLYGYTDYRAKHIVGNEKKKKKIKE